MAHLSNFTDGLRTVILLVAPFPPKHIQAVDAHNSNTQKKKKEVSTQILSHERRKRQRHCVKSKRDKVLDCSRNHRSRKMLLKMLRLHDSVSVLSSVTF